MGHAGSCLAQRVGGLLQKSDLLVDARYGGHEWLSEVVDVENGCDALRARLNQRELNAPILPTLVVLQLQGADDIGTQPQRRHGNAPNVVGEIHRSCIPPGVFNDYGFTRLDDFGTQYFQSVRSHLFVAPADPA